MQIISEKGITGHWKRIKSAFLSGEIAQIQTHRNKKNPRQKKTSGTGWGMCEPVKVYFYTKHYECTSKTNLLALRQNSENSFTVISTSKTMIQTET